MTTSGFIAAVLLLGAVQAEAQKADTASRPTASLSTDNTGPVGPNDSDDGSTSPRCWLGCRHSLQHTSGGSAPAEWSGSAQSRIDSLGSHLSRQHHTPAGPGAGAPAANGGQGGSEGQVAAGAQGSRSAAESGVATATGGGAASAASDLDTDRYLIVEWRQSELNIADSLHHAVLVRLSRRFDSAQRADVSPDDRLRIDREVDGINSINQMMWIERRVGVWRQADSALRALVGTP